MRNKRKFAYDVIMQALLYMNFPSSIPISLFTKSPLNYNYRVHVLTAIAGLKKIIPLASTAIKKLFIRWKSYRKNPHLKFQYLPTVLTIFFFCHNWSLTSSFNIFYAFVVQQEPTMKRKGGTHSKDFEKPTKIVRINQISSPTRWSVTNHEYVIATTYINLFNNPCRYSSSFHHHISNDCKLQV